MAVRNLNQRYGCARHILRVMRGHSLSKTGVNALLIRASMTSLPQGQAIPPCWRMSLVDCRVKPGNDSVERRCAGQTYRRHTPRKRPLFRGDERSETKRPNPKARPFLNSAVNSKQIDSPC